MKKPIFSLFAVFVSVQFVFASSITRVFDTQEDWNTCTLSHCDTLTNPGAVKILRIHDDEFNGDELSSFWQWEVGQFNGSDRGDYAFGPLGFVAQGFLSLTTWPPDGTPKPLTEWWGTIDTAPKIYQQLDPNEDFEIETYVQAPSSPYNNYGSQGIFVRSDSLNAIVIAYEGSDDAGVRVGSWKMSDGSITNSEYSSSFSMFPDFLYLRFKKEGTTMQAYYRETPEDEWTLINGYTVNYKNAYFGVYHKHTNIKGAYGNFDYVRFYGSKTFTAGTVTSPAIDLGKEDPGSGIIRWMQDIPENGASIRFFTQTTSNPASWPVNWDGPYTNFNGNIIKSPAKRYIRFRAVLNTDDYEVTPSLNYAAIEYTDMTEDDSILRNFKAYPTITNGNMTIKYDLLKEANSVKIDFKDSSGKTKHTFESGTNPGEAEMSFDASSYANGVYFLKISVVKKDGRKEEQVVKIVVKK